MKINSDINGKEELLEEQMQALMEGKTVEWMKNKTYGYIKLMAYYRCAIKEIETKFSVLDEEYSIQFDRNPICSIKTRLKSFPSVIEKMEKRGIPISVETMEENINDIAGVRVICAFQDDVYSLANSLLKQDDITLIERKDYIVNPKPNGYRSLHLIVSVPIFLAEEKRIMKVEIQFRTIAMDSWASLEHQLRYKKEKVFTQDMEDNLYKCAELSAELDFLMDELRGRILK